MPALKDSDLAARVQVVKDHIHCENAHDLDAIMQTFGETAGYHDDPWDEHYIGRDAVRTYYEQLIRAIPDLAIEVKRQYVAEEVVILEVVISGTHSGAWRGLPGTGHRLEFPLCVVYTFDEKNMLAGERIYYDRATILRQLGFFHEPMSVLGRVMTTLTHPLTIARTLWRAMTGQ